MDPSSREGTRKRSLRIRDRHHLSGEHRVGVEHGRAGRIRPNAAALSAALAPARTIRRLTATAVPADRRVTIAIMKHASRNSQPFVTTSVGATGHHPLVWRREIARGRGLSCRGQLQHRPERWPPSLCACLRRLRLRKSTENRSGTAIPTGTGRSRLDAGHIAADLPGVQRALLASLAIGRRDFARSARAMARLEGGRLNPCQIAVPMSVSPFPADTRSARSGNLSRACGG